MPKFIDEATISFKAGDGGNGIVAFHREKYVDKGGPSGGDGGNGGSIFIVGDNNQSTLYDLSYKKIFKGDNGENGKSGNKRGSDAEDLLINVPIGTIARTVDGQNLGELTEQGQRILIARGGFGGRGNAKFKSAVNTVPRLSDNGSLGEEKLIHLELKILADIALVGYPSVGKSSLISKMTNAKPKIADYEFTTLIPNIGICSIDNTSYVIADVPGLIEGASDGKGLGHQFLKHIERCGFILHIADASKEIEEIEERLRIIKDELSKHSEKLSNTEMQLVFNKIDIVEQEKIDELKSKYPNALFLSVFSKEDIDLIKHYCAKEIKRIREEQKNNFVEESSFHYYKHIPKQMDIVISQGADGFWQIRGSLIEYWVKRIPLHTDQNYVRFRQKMISIGLFDRLREQGYKDGEPIEINQNGVLYEMT